MAGPSSNQAIDDAWSYSEQSFSGNLFFDVRANDSLKKALHSIDNGQVADLGTADLTRSAAASNDRSALGATIWITSDGRVGYSADSVRDLVDQLAQGETIVDSFLYAMKQGSSIVWATVRVTITGTNDAPVATADVAVADEGALVTGSVATNDRDVDHGALLSYAATGPQPAGFAMASNGSWAFDASDPAYQALAAGETVQLVVAYRVTDEHGAAANSTLTITVTGTNDAPLVTGAVSAAAVEGGASSTLNALANASDVDAGTNLAVVGVPATLPAGVSYDPATKSFTLDPNNAAYQSLAAGATTTVSVSYGVSDGIATTPASASWTVTGANDAPTVTGAVSGSAAEDGATSTLAALANASDADEGAVLSVVGVPQELPAGVSYDPDSKSFTLDPADPAYQSLGAGATLTVSVGYGVSDGTATTPASVVWTVTGTNDGPVACAATATVAEDQAIGGTLVATDADADSSLVFEPYWGGPDGFILAADGSWSFDANQYEYQSLAEGESRDVAIEYVVTDDHGETSVSTLTVTVTGANDAPVTTSHWAEATENEIATGTLFALDQDNGAVLSFAVEGEAPAGFTLNPDGSWTFDGANPAYDGLMSGEVRLIQVPFSVTDEHGGTISSFMIIALTGSNDAPVQGGGPVTLPAGVEDTAYTVTQEQLLAGWSDAEGTGLQAIDLTATNATVTDNGDGSFTITPAANFNGTIDLKYQVTDGSAAVITGTELTVAAANDPAYDFTGQSAGTIKEDSSTSYLYGDVNFRDVDNVADSWVQQMSPVQSDLGVGTFTVAANGFWYYRLDNSNPLLDTLNTGQTLTDTFTIVTQDGTAKTISISINGRTDWTYAPPPTSTAPDPWDYDSHRDWKIAPSPVNLTGTSAFDSFDGSNGADTLVGMGSSDGLYGHGGNDTIYGDFNDPTLQGQSNWSDTIYGQAGNDVIYGGLGSDTIYGGSGDDLIYGNETSFADPTSIDGLMGGSGNDTIVGSNAVDYIRGGTGADTLTGGGAADRFVYVQLGDTGDTITDFQSGQDRIELGEIGLTNLRFVGQVAAPNALDPGQIGYTIVDGVTTLYIDKYGSAPGIDFELVLIGSINLGASDVVW